MKRYSLPRVAHCNEGHGKVPDMTENCPQHFLRIVRIPGLVPSI